MYEYLNGKNNSYRQMLSRLQRKIVENRYRINKTDFNILIEDTKIVWENENVRGSNINEFFEVIDW